MLLFYWRFTSCSFLRLPLDSTGNRCNIRKSLPWDRHKRTQNQSFNACEAIIILNGTQMYSALAPRESSLSSSKSESRTWMQARCAQTSIHNGTQMYSALAPRESSLSSSKSESRTWMQARCAQTSIHHEIEKVEDLLRRPSILTLELWIGFSQVESNPTQNKHYQSENVLHHWLPLSGDDSQSRQGLLKGIGEKKILIFKLLFFFKKSDSYMLFFKIPEIFLKINLWK